MRPVQMAFLMVVLLAAPVAAQAPPHCAFVCKPIFTLQVAGNRSHIASAPRVRDLHTDSVTRLPSTTNTEIMLVVSAATAIPRTSLFVSTQWLPTATRTRNPFTEYTAGQLGDSALQANAPSVTMGLSVAVLTAAQTGGFLALSPYVGDLFSNAARPDDQSSYTHKLDIGLNLTITPLAPSTDKSSWLHALDAFVLLDDIVTGLPKAGDEVPRGARVFLDDAHALSLIVGVGLPVAW